MAIRTVPYNESIHCSEKCLSKFLNGKLECDCGNDIRIYEWFWEKDEGETNFQLDPKNFIVTFHPVYSSGTSVVRGNKPFQQNMHYYWEMKMISKLYGTDVMIGIGTKEGFQNFTNYRFRFCSMLGLDNQTWGYSYHGKIQHDKLTRIYGEGFGLSSKVGVHLDMCTGKLEYYLNRKPLGIAFSGLKKKELYPMACATAAQSSMKLICAVSQEQTLQMLCLQCVHQNSYLYEKYSSIPGLCKIYRQKYFWMTPKISTSIPTKEQEEEELYFLALNNNSAKRKQEANYLVTPKSNKKSSTEFCSSREPNLSSNSNRASPLRMDLQHVPNDSLLRFLSQGTLDHSDDLDSP